MNNLFIFFLSLVAGFVLGTFFFAGLRWTVRRGILSNSPALWFLGSMLLRMSLVLTGFYLVGRGDWMRLATCLLGFIIARSTVMRLTRTPPEHPDSTVKEASHAT
jgi:F1F0 ATPase subunit 2